MIRERIKKGEVFKTEYHTTFTTLTWIWWFPVPRIKKIKIIEVFWFLIRLRWFLTFEKYKSCIVAGEHIDSVDKDLGLKGENTDKWRLGRQIDMVDM